ncbi:MAG TPA: hypothetical protein VIC51_11100 [Psychromonas sp.]
MKNCNDCRYAVNHEDGYSNYTVTGIDFTCLLNKHPDNGFDVWYGESKELSQADKCGSYTYSENAPAYFDVDGEINPEEAFCGDSELIEMWNAGDF